MGLIYNTTQMDTAQAARPALVGFANLRAFPYQGKNPFLKFLS